MERHKNIKIKAKLCSLAPTLRARKVKKEKRENLYFCNSCNTTVVIVFAQIGNVLFI